jgi:hypothetical protein
MRVIRQAENAASIVGGTWQGIQSQLEKFAAADAEFQRDLEHQPVAQSAVGREDVWKRQVAARIAPRPDCQSNRLDIRIFQGLNPRRWACAHSKGSE